MITTPRNELATLVEAIRPDDEMGTDHTTVARLVAFVEAHPEFARPVLAVAYEFEIEHDANGAHFACPRCTALRRLVRDLEDVVIDRLLNPRE